MLVRGEGVFVWDDQGRRYLDGASSLWYANVGHGRAEINDAISAQLAELESFHTFGDLRTGRRSSWRSVSRRSRRRRARRSS